VLSLTNYLISGFSDDVHLDPVFRISFPIAQCTLSSAPLDEQSSPGTEPSRLGASGQEPNQDKPQFAQRQRLQVTWELKIKVRQGQSVQIHRIKYL